MTGSAKSAFQRLEGRVTIRTPRRLPRLQALVGLLSLSRAGGGTGQVLNDQRRRLVGIVGGGHSEPACQAPQVGATYSAEAAGTAEAAAASFEAPRPTDETGHPADWLRGLAQRRCCTALLFFALLAPWASSMWKTEGPFPGPLPYRGEQDSNLQPRFWRGIEADRWSQERHGHAVRGVSDQPRSAERRPFPRPARA